MVKQRPVTSYIVIKALLKLGFVILRKTGSHIRLKHPDGRVTTVPAHGKDQIGIGLLLRILKDADLSKDEFFRMADEV
jgi:predicted RNA binding protein YcfA (HicA-like mRNA interferase family)